MSIRRYFDIKKSFGTLIRKTDSQLSSMFADFSRQAKAMKLDKEVVWEVDQNMSGAQQTLASLYKGDSTMVDARLEMPGWHIRTGSQSAYEGTSLWVWEDGLVITTGDSMGFPDYFGHARGGDVKQKVPMQKVKTSVQEFLKDWEKSLKEQS